MLCVCDANFGRHFMCVFYICRCSSWRRRTTLELGGRHANRVQIYCLFER